MNKSTIILNESLLRAAKMVISAWQEWLDEKKKQK